MVHTTRGVTLCKHGCALFFEALLGAVIQSGNAGQRHDQGQALPQRHLVGTFEETIDIVVVDEAQHAVRVAVQLQCVLNARRQFLSGSATRHHIAHTAIEREIQHALHDRRAF